MVGWTEEGGKEGGWRVESRGGWVYREREGGSWEARVESGSRRIEGMIEEDRRLRGRRGEVLGWKHKVESRSDEVGRLEGAHGKKR